MSDPIFDNTGKQIAHRVGNEAVSLDGQTSYNIDSSGNLIDKETGKIIAHLIPAGAYLPNGQPSPGQSVF
ncbi:hypothetical protein AB8A20_04820 [Tardiphaga sp. 604_B6_N1_1]|uniref:hypothetical protein n=1 Tax=Tardiphaga sp. 604_B6_N1_1 TaxID=3240779 RepID=UPI003F2532A8